MIAKCWDSVASKWWRSICSILFLCVYIYVGGEDWARAKLDFVFVGLAVVGWATPLLLLKGHPCWSMIPLLVYAVFGNNYEDVAQRVVFYAGSAMQIAVICFYSRFIWSLRGRLFPAIVFAGGLGWLASPWPLTSGLCTPYVMAWCFVGVTIILGLVALFSKKGVYGYFFTIVAYIILAVALCGRMFLAGNMTQGAFYRMVGRVNEMTGYWFSDKLVGFVPGARNNIAHSKYDQACKYRNGDGVTKDVKKARELFFECVRDGGEDVCAAKLAIVELVMEFGPKEEEADATKLLDRLAEKDQYEPAQKLLAKMIVAKAKGGKSVKDSLEELDRAARYGSEEAMLMLGRYYAGGEGFFGNGKDSDKARKYLIQAAEKGSVEAPKLLRELD